jgi:hypothetical protein
MGKTQHKDLPQSELHIPKIHATSHMAGASDEVDHNTLKNFEERYHIKLNGENACVVEFGSGDGGAFNLGPLGYWALVNFHSLDNFQKYDPGNNYNNATDKYTFPFSGFYHIQTQLRIMDWAEDDGGYAQGAVWNLDYASDTPSMGWFETAGAIRHGSSRDRYGHFNAGEYIRMFTYGLDFINPTWASDGVMIINPEYPD